jgi:hypothetical protein
MSGFAIFAILWLGFCAVLLGGFINALCGDSIAVVVLRFIDSPLYPEARHVAALIYQHPEQWQNSSYSLEHPKVGSITGSIALTIEVQGSFGKWEPGRIERRIIFNAVQWYRTAYMKHLLAKGLMQL